MIGHGVSSRSSHSCAAGRTTPSAKPCTHSRMSFWSWLSSRLKPASAPPPPSSARVACATASSAIRASIADKLTSIHVTLFRVGEPPYALAVSELRRIRPGLWRWTAPHPEWVAESKPESPSDWPRDVGCVLCDAPDATVLIDPLVVKGDDRLLQRLDRYVRSRGLPVSILTTIKWHRRSRDELARRYGAQTSRARANLPTGVESKPVRGAGETMFWLAEHRALVPGDRLLGARGGGLRICPESWLGYPPR